MTCHHVKLPSGKPFASAIVCTSEKRKRCACGRRADLLCDWKVPGQKSGTCDKPICSICTTSPAPDKDLCPGHAAEFAEWKSRREHGR